MPTNLASYEYTNILVGPVYVSERLSSQCHPANLSRRKVPCLRFLCLRCALFGYRGPRKSKFLADTHVPIHFPSLLFAVLFPTE
jgi:hypothetical protein